MHLGITPCMHQGSNSLHAQRSNSLHALSNGIDGTKMHNAEYVGIKTVTEVSAYRPYGLPLKRFKRCPKSSHIDCVVLQKIEGMVEV